MGTSNKVNKGIAQTIKKNAGDFFFLHNGITAICSQMAIHDNILSVKELNVVNGCQSLSTIFSCSESAKKADDAYIMFRFYEISNPDRADNIRDLYDEEYGHELARNHLGLLGLGQIADLADVRDLETRFLILEDSLQKKERTKKKKIN